MELKTTKNGKQYRCDECQKLLGIGEVRYLRISPSETYHFCTWTHRQSFATSRYNLPLPLESGYGPMTGSVIPVKNPGRDQ